MSDLSIAADPACFHDLTRTDCSVIPGVPKPCPFCGGADSLGVIATTHEDDEHTYNVLCETCATRGPSADTHLDACVQWNRRLDQDAVEHARDSVEGPN
jgi:Lar family restriction alleviation protein